jgi:hypothetical protein
MKFILKLTWLSSFVLLLFINSVSATPVVRTAAGVNAAAIQATVDQFRTDLGGALNPNNGQSFQTGRREINWDGVPDNLSSPNFMPNDFFNVNSPRGVVLSATTPFDNSSAFLVSAKTGNPTNTAVRFGEIDPSYANIFQTFSPQRLFIARNATTTSVSFFIPGTKIPATVSGFGVIFTDVDASENTLVKFYGIDGKSLGTASAPAANNGLSFVGVLFNAGERVARVEIISGNTALENGKVDGNNGADVIAMDDFIYGEPHAREHHESDFDGDGVADLSVFRPSTGEWFVFNSGSNTFNFVPFGLNGDAPVDGDFDGDGKNDLAVFRPSSGTWFVLNSSDAQVQTVQFGLAGDKPVAGDYDKDGKTDIAVWRPSEGNYFILRSTNGQAQITHWGSNGDLPIGAAQ